MIPERGTAARRGYGSRWQKARATYLKSHPLCVMCQAQGRTTAATVVDHIEPHRGDMTKFWDTNNWQALCKRCHDSHKQRQEKGGAMVGCSTDGIPLDPAHHWRKGWGG